jgi:hypothetical protein
MTREEQLEQWHTASLFMSKVFSACRDKNVHPHDEDHGIILDDLMVDAEKETGVFVSQQELDIMNRFPRSRIQDARRRRRAFAYSLLIRVTSGGIVR